MKTEEVKQLFEQFEEAAAEMEGVECWSARELYPILGYSQWRNFMNAVDKAKESCQKIFLRRFGLAEEEVRIVEGKG